MGVIRRMFEDFGEQHVTIESISAHGDWVLLRQVWHLRADRAGSRVTFLVPPRFARGRARSSSVGGTESTRTPSKLWSWKSKRRRRSRRCRRTWGTRSAEGTFRRRGKLPAGLATSWPRRPIQ